MSMVLASTPHRRRTPRRNRSIPTISTGRVDVGLVDVSAVDTGLPEGPTLRGRGGGAGFPSPRACLPLPGLAPPAPAQRPEGRGSASTPARVSPRGRATPRGWGSTGRGLCVLHEGPTYLECPRPSSSSSRPSCSSGQTAPERRRAAVPALAEETSNDHQVRRAGVLRRHDPEALGGHETTQRPAERARLRRCRERAVGVVETDGSTTPTTRQSGEPALSSGAPAARSGPTPWRPRPGAGRRWRPRCRWGAWCRPRRPR